jgi:hypothetical protein
VIKYIAKPDTWFKEGTEAKLIDDYRLEDPSLDFGLFEGIKICENPKSESHKIVGEEYQDQEICFFEEFEEIDVEDHQV